MRDKLDKLIIKISNKLMFDKFNEDNNGMGVVEVILIILVLVGLALIFKTKITSIVNTIFSKITSQVNSF